jgi:hypothetical protein
MQNGKLTAVRVIASGIIGVLAVAGGVFLLHEGHAIPVEFWGIAALAIAGVVGADIAAAVYNRLKPQ